jgi:hypothetical protein
MQRKFSLGADSMIFDLKLYFPIFINFLTLFNHAFLNEFLEINFLC